MPAVPCYSCNMTTNTAMKQTGTAPTAIDFDTRLAIADAGITARLAHHHGVALADAQAALADAESSILEPETPEFKPHPVLAKAAQIIRKYGWVKGTYGSTSFGMCAMRAIREAVYGPNWLGMVNGERENGPVLELLNRIAVETGQPMSVPHWNDSREDVSQVLKLLY